MKRWITKDGKELNIADMETTHIKNCIGMLQRRMPDLPLHGEWVKADHWSLPGAVYEHGQDDYQKWIDAFEAELAKRAELPTTN